MRTLSDTLLAAQKNPDHLPYVEAKVYDFEQGVKRLSWTRLYEGSEPDNHHGIAFDDQGSMHRIRAEVLPSNWQASTAYALGDFVSPTNYNGHKYECTTAGTSGTTEPTWPTTNGNTVTDGSVVWTCRGINLYRQKVPNPDETSNFSNWSLITDNCAGPCAIAACGAKVYIFYRTTSNVLWKYYSHDYGQNWQNAQLVDYANALSMAACWRGTTDIVVCFALRSNEINGIVLDTSNQTASQHIYNFGQVHVIDGTYGIGATYHAGVCQIIFAAREITSTYNPLPYNAFNLFRTEFDSTYHFLAIKSFFMSPEGEDITYEYPDCHIPTDTDNGHETTRITAVEKFSGTTAYTLPITSHLVKDGDFSDAIFTEPKPFLNISSNYGLRITSNSDYWWLERPNSIWRAPRAAGEPLDLTKDIVSLTQRLSTNDSGLLTIELDNSRGQYANPVARGLIPRSEVVLKLGYRTTAGNEAVEVGRYWVDGWDYHSTPNRSLFTLHCLDGWGLADRWSARYQMTWGQIEFPGYTVWQILETLLCRWGIRLWNNPSPPQSNAINNFYPAFVLQPGTTGNRALITLLSFIPDALIYDGNKAYTKDLRSDEESCYTYDVIASGAWQSHPILSGEYSDHIPITRARAIGRDSDDNRIVEDAFDWDNLKLGIDTLEQDYDPNLYNTIRTQERADAILRRESLRAQRGNLIIPVNCGQELYDVITVTDKRCGIDNKKYRVLTIQTDYNAHKGIYQQKLTLGAP